MSRQRRRRDWIQRNAPCPCGSGKKAKYCHGTTGVSGLTGPQTLDWMTGFLEQHVLPELPRLTACFKLDYDQLFLRWAADPIHEAPVFDTDKCLRLKQLAEDRLRVIAQSYPRRLLIQALRTLPFGYLCLITIHVDASRAAALLRTASTAAYLFGSDPLPGRSVHEGSEYRLQVAPDEYQSWVQNLGRTLARLLGATFAYISAQEAFRMAGKGAALARPSHEMIARAQQGDITLLPRLEFAPDAALERAVSEYDGRRRRSGMGVAGFGEIEPQIGSGWWRVVVGSPLKPKTVSVSYPELKQTWTSSSFFIYPVDIEPLWAELEPFADQFHRRFGIDYASFRVLCTALFDIVAIQTGWALLKVDTDSPGQFRLRSSLSPGDPAATTAPRFLYDLFARASLRGPRKGYLTHLVDALRAAGATDPESAAGHFLERFSQHSSPDFNFEPSLFFVVDQHLIMLDFLKMNEFFDLILRQVTSGDDEMGNSRGTRFEETARDRIIAALGIQPAQIPVAHTQDVMDGLINRGNPDLAFMWKSVLVNLDMKSWQKSPRYFHGEYNAIANRVRDLVRLMGKVDARGRTLAQFVAEKGVAPPSGVLNLLCVADVEYVPPGETVLWYGEMPRVLTATEIMELLQDDALMRTVTAAANASIE